LSFCQILEGQAPPIENFLATVRRLPDWQTEHQEAVTKFSHDTFLSHCTTRRCEQGGEGGRRRSPPALKTTEMTSFAMILYN